MSYNIHKVPQPRRGANVLPQLPKPTEPKDENPHPNSTSPNFNQFIIDAISKLVSSNQETMRAMVESFKNERGTRNEEPEKASEASWAAFMESRFTHIDLNVPKLSAYS